MSEDDSKRDEEAREQADAQAILARRRMFVATALSGLTLGATAAVASCEAQVSGSASVNGELSTGGNGGAHPCLMVAYIPPADSAANSQAETADAYTVVGTEQTVILTTPTMDAGTSTRVQSNPTLPQNGTAAPCLSVARVVTTTHADAGVVQTHPAPCLEIAGPLVNGNVPRVRDAGVAVPRPCLRYAGPPTLTADAGASVGVTVSPTTTPVVRPVESIPQPCLSPVRMNPKDQDE